MREVKAQFHKALRMADMLSDRQKSMRSMRCARVSKLFREGGGEMAWQTAFVIALVAVAFAVAPLLAA